MPRSTAPVVLIDGREISKKRGIGHFCREFLYNINMCVEDTDTQYFCLIPNDTSEYLQKQFEKIHFIKKNLLDPVLWEQFTLPMEAIRVKASHLVCPYNTFPICSPPSLKRIIIYHDLIFLHAARVGGGTKLFIGNKYRSFLLRFLKQSDRLLTVSSYTKELMLRFFKLESTVIGNSCSQFSAILKNIRANDLHGEYFLHVGGDALTKNSRHIISSYLSARKSRGAAYPKLIVMGVSRAFADTMRSTLGFGDEILFHFGISEEEKGALFKGALAIVFVSTQEGFGLPIIEAHAAQKRVITSRRRPMSDIAAPTDLLVWPNDEYELVSAYHLVANKPDRLLPVAVEWQEKIDQFRIIEDLVR